MGRMIRKQVYIEPAQDALLKLRSAELDVSEAELVRRGIEAAAGGAGPDSPRHQKGGEEVAALVTAALDDPGLSRSLLGHARQVASGRGQSLAAFLREAIDEKIARSVPKPRSLGIGNSGQGDTARRIAEGPVPPRSWRSS